VTEGQPRINRLPQSLPGSGTPIGADMGGYFTTEPHRLVSLSTHQSEARSLG